MTLSHEKTIEQKYQVLSEVEHVRKRLGVYAGSSTEHIAQEYVFDGRGMVIEKLSYIPAALKCINEILDNAIDEHKRDPKKLNKISVTVNENTGEIIIEDNGGIPVVKHSEFDMYVPEIIFGMLRSGSNYDDSEDQQVIGTNGLGSKLTNILSTSFIVETADGINKFKQEFKNGMREKSDPKVVPIKKNYTTIQFTLDWDFFNTSLNADLINKIQMAVINAAGNNPKCKFTFNDEQIKIKSFKDYIDLYTTDYIYEETDDWKIGIAPADQQGFEQVSFVNSVNTFSGGTHIDYVMNQITNEVRLLIKKKHKIEVKPSDIKNQMRLFLSCNVNRPTFNSQTKEFMTSEPKTYHTEWKCSNSFIKKIMESEVVQSILDWAAAKEEANKRADLRKLNKNADKMNPKKVAKFVDATSKIRTDCMLFLAEGDCFDETLPIKVLNDDGDFIEKIASEVKPGDMVLTHNHNIKEVTDVFKKIHSYISINGRKFSPEHRLYVYNKDSDEFMFIKVKDIKQDIHKLVKNRLNAVQFVEQISVIHGMQDDNLIHFETDFRDCTTSSSHKWPVFNVETNSFIMKLGNELSIDDCLIFMKTK